MCQTQVICGTVPNTAEGTNKRHIIIQLDNVYGLCRQKAMHGAETYNHNTGLEVLSSKCQAYSTFQSLCCDCISLPSALVFACVDHTGSKLTGIDIRAFLMLSDCTTGHQDHRPLGNGKMQHWPDCCSTAVPFDTILPCMLFTPSLRAKGSLMHESASNTIPNIAAGAKLFKHHCLCPQVDFKPEGHPLHITKQQRLCWASENAIIFLLLSTN